MFIFEQSKYFAQCHASTLAMMPDKRIMSAWFAGTAEGFGDTAIWASFFKDAKWSEPKQIAKVNNLPHWNPVLFTTPDKEVLLYFKTGENPTEWKTWVTKIEDDKASAILGLFDINKVDEEAKGPVRCKPIVLSNNTWLAPNSVEKIVGNRFLEFPSLSGRTHRALVEWKAFADISKNYGITWDRGETIDFDREKFAEDGIYGGVIQPTAWESQEGKVHMLLRSTAGRIFRSDSSDYGKTWCMAYPIALPNNNSGIDLISFEKAIFLTYNPVQDNWGARTPLSIACSLDNGNQWLKILDLENGSGSFSYPSIISTSKGFALTYTWNRRSIVFREFNVTIEPNRIKVLEEKY